MIGLGSDKQCKRRWSLKNPDQKGSFKFQQEGPQWVCDMVRLWSDLGAIKQCLHQRHRLRRRPLLPLHPSLSRQLAGWWHDAGGAADDDGDAILMMMLTWWIWHYVGAIEQLAFLCGKILVCAFALFALFALLPFCPSALFALLLFWRSALFALTLFCLLLFENCFCFLLFHCTSNI